MHARMPHAWSCSHATAGAPGAFAPNLHTASPSPIIISTTTITTIFAHARIPVSAHRFTHLKEACTCAHTHAHLNTGL